MEILLISGHTSGHNMHKQKLRNEGDLNIELVNLIKPLLEKYANVHVYPMERDAFVDVQKGQFKAHLPKGIDYVLEVHFNALDGQYNADGRNKGSEMFVTTREKAISVEQAIMRHMDDYFPLRDNDGVFDGVKRTNFLVINTLKSMGISGALLETCFYDDEDDMKVYYANKEAIAQGIVDGIAEGFGLKAKPQPKPQPPKEPTPPQPQGTKYKVGTRVCTNTVWTQANGGTMHKGDWQGTITKIFPNTLHPYLLDKGDIGFTNDEAIDSDPHYPSGQPQPTEQYYKAFNNVSIVMGLKSIGVDSSYNHRKQIARANGILNYTGTADQNDQLTALARKGKLIKA